MLCFSMHLTSQSMYNYDYLLGKYVSIDGKVDYRGFISEQEKFDEFLTHISSNPPKDNWSENEKMAYWINAYNAYTIKLIIDNYPVSSITDLHPILYIPLLNTVWHKEFFKIDGIDFSLHKIEHEILRGQFSDPRIHFAINCASVSCPALLNEPYSSKELECQLRNQSAKFIYDASKNKFEQDELKLSKIFSWFESDFDEFGGVIPFLNEYLTTPINVETNIEYLPYHWELNE
jgi:hypothetical protein